MTTTLPVIFSVTTRTRLFFNYYNTITTVIFVISEKNALKCTGHSRLSASFSSIKNCVLFYLKRALFYPIPFVEQNIVNYFFKGQIGSFHQSYEYRRCTRGCNIYIGPSLIPGGSIDFARLKRQLSLASELPCSYVSLRMQYCNRNVCACPSIFNFFFLNRPSSTLIENKKQTLGKDIF